MKEIEACIELWNSTHNKSMEIALMRTVEKSVTKLYVLRVVKTKRQSAKLRKDVILVWKLIKICHNFLAVCKS